MGFFIEVILDLFLEFFPFVVIFGLVSSFLKKISKKITTIPVVNQPEVINYGEDDKHPVYHQNESFGMAHKDTREHRIYEQSKREAQYSEAQPARIGDQFVRLSRDNMGPRRAVRPTLKVKEPEQLIKNTVFRNQNEVRNALIYGEILGTPVSKK